MKTSLRTAACGLAVWLLPQTVAAEEPVASPCAAAVTRQNLIACALAFSPALRAEAAAVRAGEGRREAARPLLPSNPVLSGSLASRTGDSDRAVNWNLSLGQELEIAGQRGLRLEVADAELRAQTQRLAAVKASVAEDAWSAYFRALAAGERLTLALKLEGATEAASATARGMTAAGLGSEIDADLAEAAALRASQDRVRAEQQVAITQAALQLLTGSTALVSGALEPLPRTPTAEQPRPELLAAQEEQRALSSRVDSLRRARVPNPTVSLFAQNDGFNERVFGVGLSFPIPLPHPLGRTQAGGIAETLALAEKADAEAQRTGRVLSTELSLATAEYEASAKIRALYTPERVERAATRLEAIAGQFKAARLPVRDALLAQQALVDQLKAHLDAREALCVASVRLTRAAGLSLEGDSR